MLHTWVHSPAGDPAGGKLWTLNPAQSRRISVEEVEASMVAAAIRLSLQEAGSSSPAAQPQQLGPTGPASLKMVRDTPALCGAITRS